MNDNTVVKHLRGDLLHYTYQSYEEHGRQMERFSTIAAKAMYDKKRPVYRMNLWVNPLWAFIKGYIIRLGFLDGKEGFMIARFTAIQSYLKYRKLSRLYHQKQQPE